MPSAPLLWEALLFHGHGWLHLPRGCRGLRSSGLAEDPTQTCLLASSRCFPALAPGPRSPS